jgi:cobalt-zinc-cadmium efflux system protein
VVEAVGRFSSEPVVASTSMLVVGVIGLVINIVTMLLLRAGSKESLNVKGAYFEVVSDAAGSVGVIVAGLLVLATGNGLWDTIVALAIGIFVAVRAVVLGRQVLAVLGQHIPQGMKLDDVVADLEAVAGVGDVHDLHIWTLTSGMNVATAHLVVESGSSPQDVLSAARTVLAERHHIEHATLQVEDAPTKQCHEINW